MQVEELWRQLSRDVVELIATFRSRLPALSVSAKPDRTLLTDADTAVQDCIIERIRNLDPHSPIIAEEDDNGAHRRAAAGSTYVWIVDPIDGTAQFVEPSAVEFCSVVALYEYGHPSAALVVAPEIGPGRTPIIVSAHDHRITVNGKRIQTGPRELTGHASTTRSQGRPPSHVERSLTAKGYDLKVRTTSQTLDLVRTAFDLTAFAPDARPFDLFHRRQQKLWDGAAGFCLAQAAGLSISDEDGRPIVPLTRELMTQAEPVLPSSLVGPEALVNALARGEQCLLKSE